ncbi:hypothetical protein FOXG_06758 [Fusarium oxysporum f. sp. lycopersici 4287]|uniref:PiggyBac transposable element-derived protein domain-containing protein n=1 Tax=Fusarium oxysporum f. sp. lycopersici (strain 4287 / CBS 123668 / FGSC 9935 / NRRL 34936) TaxID=426428 RepID=A0A0J9V071_FUSO4|nr:hypothetical protein FOXG_06758 [Fusarium oxysporum f. sp. lycopersici 4287]KNB04720.1 hypothetical protein FOXG_06758 [Fusarium oxysporum f. sp. lycopersici 4287]
MALSGSYGRGHRRAQPQEGLMPSVYRQVDRWSKHIQGTGDSMYVPGSDLTVDEAMVRFTGRSLETTTIPQKPTPTGYKVWVLRQSGYFCSRQGDEEVAEEHLTPTQRVVTALLTLLPLAVYHVFLDNLLAGVDELLVAEKDREGKGIPWGQMHCIPTKDGKFSWKDNALVLFLTTVFREGNQVIRSRRWPAASSAANRAAREVFGSELGKDLRVPLGIDEHSHHTNGVDTGDQLRSYNQYSRPIRRGGWQSIAWNFLLEVILVNSFLLQIWGEPEWKAFESQYQWRRHLSAQLIQRFGSSDSMGKSIVEVSAVLTPLA